jgi:hypothetical protein
MTILNDPKDHGRKQIVVGVSLLTSRTAAGRNITSRPVAAPMLGQEVVGVTDQGEKAG